MCSDHAPQWAREGKKQSPPVKMFGILQSWYILIAQ